MYRKLTAHELAQVGDTIIDATNQPALKRYVEEIYGDEAYSAQVQVHRLSTGVLTSLRVLVYNEDDEYLYPDVNLPYWQRVTRETDTFLGMKKPDERAIAAEAYLLMCQVPQIYGIACKQTGYIILDEIKSLEDIALYVQDGLPLRTLNLTYPQLSVEEKVSVSPSS